MLAISDRPIVREEDPIRLAGRTYHASADYLTSFVAYLELHARGQGHRTFELEHVRDRLDEVERKLLQ